MSRLSLTILLGLALCAAAYEGDGTAYSGDGQKDDTGFNACGFGDIGDHWEKYYAAVPEDMFSKSKCGECAKVCGADGCVLAKVVDACASCSYGDIDLSKRALKDATGFEWDRKAVTWEYTSCSDDGSDSGSSSSKTSKTSKKKKSKKSKKSSGNRKLAEQARQLSNLFN